MKKISTIFVLTLATTFLSACSFGKGNDEIPNITLPTSISIDPTELTLEIGESYREVKVSFIPTTADKSLTWTSTDSTIVEVNQLGDIKAIKAGTAKVIATSKVDENVKSELSVTVKRGPLTIKEKINNSLGNIKFEGKAYKELYGEGATEPGTILEDTMMSQFTSNSYHFELGKGFDTMDFGGQAVSLWYEEGTVYQYLHNAFTNIIEKHEALYDDGTKVSWDEFKNPMYIVKDLKADKVENELKLDTTKLETLNLARLLVERVAFWPFEAQVIDNVTLNFNETRLTNITFRTTKHSDKFQECVYGASLDVVGYGEEVLDYPKPEPISPTEEQLKLEKAFKEIDENNFVMDYRDTYMTFAEGEFFKTSNVVFYKDASSDKFSRGVCEINGEVFEIGYSFELKKLARLSTPITYKDETKATFKEVSPSFSGISSVFFAQDENNPNLFILRQGQLCQQFGNLIANCAGPFDLGMITSDSTEVTLTEEGKLKSIAATYGGVLSATLSLKQLGGEITLPINVADLPEVTEF